MADANVGQSDLPLFVFPDMLTTLDVHCTDRRTGQALSGVEVAVGAAGQGHQTDDKGVVSIQEVFVGQNPVRVVAKRNGYKTVDSTFKLIAGLKRQELHIKMSKYHMPIRRQCYRYK